MDNEVFFTRDGKPTPYYVEYHNNPEDMDTVIWMMKSLDYPFIASKWYGMNNPTIKKYIKIMSLAAYKDFGFKDSKRFNIHKIHNRVLKQETREDSYNQVVAIEEKEDDKHLKGYMFDSLIYRFKDYQAKAFQAEVMDYKYKRNCSDLEARKFVEGRHTRDLMRFIDILNEAIGDHD